MIYVIFASAHLFSARDNVPGQAANLSSVYISQHATSHTTHIGRRENIRCHTFRYLAFQEYNILYKGKKYRILMN